MMLALRSVNIGTMLQKPGRLPYPIPKLQPFSSASTSRRTRHYSRRLPENEPPEGSRQGNRSHRWWHAAFLGSIATTLAVGHPAYQTTANKAVLSNSSSTFYASERAMHSAITELRALLGDDHISIDEEDLKSHGYSEWSSLNPDRLPVAIVYPRSTSEVACVAKVASKYRVPMIPYSGGSSLEANFSAPFGGFSIDFTLMDRIIAIHEDDMDVVVQPGVQWIELNDHIKPQGLFFPVDPGPTARIGGMIGTSCSGTNAFRYGTMKDWVINLTVVLADGRVIKTRRRPRKTSAGYNLTGLFIGAEGTLGIITEATLRLAVVPQHTKVAVVTFPSVRSAAVAAMKMIRSGIPLAALEIMDEVQMAVINKTGGTKKRWSEIPTLFLKFAGTQAGIEESIVSTMQIAKENDSREFVYAGTDEEGQELWKARKEALWSMLAMRRDGDAAWSTDVAVPISKLPDIVEASKEDIAKIGLFGSILGHVGDGNFHSTMLYNAQSEEERDRVEKVVHDMVRRAIEMEGTCTGEHGIGLGKKKSLIEELGMDTIDIMRTLKKSLDPYWLMNPGKIFDENEE